MLGQLCLSQKKETVSDCKRDLRGSVWDRILPKKNCRAGLHLHRVRMYELKLSSARLRSDLQQAAESTAAPVTADAAAAEQAMLGIAGQTQERTYLIQCMARETQVISAKEMSSTNE